MLDIVMNGYTTEMVFPRQVFKDESLKTFHISTGLARYKYKNSVCIVIVFKKCWNVINHWDSV